LPYQLANGRFIYQPKLTGQAFRRGLLAELNIKSADAGLHPEVTDFTGYVIYKVTSPYPIVGGTVGGKFLRSTEQDCCKIYISVHDSNWIEVFAAEANGEFQKQVSIDDVLNPKPTPAIYDYYVKFELKADTVPENACMLSAYIETDVQMAATSLPALSAGVNKVVYRDDNTEPRKVSITHGWVENSDTAVPLAPAGPAWPADGAEVDVSSLKQLTWQAAEDVDGSITDYHIQISQRADMLLPISGNFDRIIYSGRPQWQLPQGWFVPGRTYYWRVRAKDDWGCWSSWSRIWRFNVTAGRKEK
jgi:hypothetical protein